MLINTFTTTAVALAGVDLCANQRNNVSSQNRRIRGVACVGSVAVNDFWVDVFAGNIFVGRFYNTNIATNAIDISADVVPVDNILVRGGDKISAICGVNAGAGDVNLAIY